MEGKRSVLEKQFNDKAKNSGKFVASGSRDLVVEPDSSLTEKISEFTVRRLSSYYRILLMLETSKVQTVSSARLAELCGLHVFGVEVQGGRVMRHRRKKDVVRFGNGAPNRVVKNLADREFFEIEP